MRQRQERCESCRFWEEVDEEFGDCRRYAPMKVLMDVESAENLKQGINEPNDHMHMRGIWPETPPDEWCGEFQPRETPSRGPRTLQWCDIESLARERLSARVRRVLRRECVPWDNVRFSDRTHECIVLWDADEWSNKKGCGDYTLKEIMQFTATIREREAACESQ